MEAVVAAIVGAHVAVAFTGLATFWVPVVARKGGTLHKRAGRLFAWCAYLVNGSALVITCLRVFQIFARGASLGDDPDSSGLTLFLGYLAIVTLASVRHAVRVVAAREAHHTIRTPFHVGLALGSILGALLVAAFSLIHWSTRSLLFLVLCPVGLAIGASILRYVLRQPAHPRAWFFEHMSSMLAAGIAFHTAFAVFGLGRLFGLAPQGAWWPLPWILPSAIGVPAAIWWERHYRRRFCTHEAGAEAELDTRSP